MNVGDYVDLTIDGIGQVKKILEKGFIALIYDGEEYWYEEKDINNVPSSNVIDVIEEGDYVNGQLVVQVSKDRDWVFTEPTYYDEHSGEERHYCYNEKEIKSIVTKEQFEERKFVLNERK